MHLYLDGHLTRPLGRGIPGEYCAASLIRYFLTGAPPLVNGFAYLMCRTLPDRLTFSFLGRLGVVYRGLTRRMELQPVLAPLGLIPRTRHRNETPYTFRVSTGAHPTISPPE